MRGGDATGALRRRALAVLVTAALVAGLTLLLPHAAPAPGGPAGRPPGTPGGDTPAGPGSSQGPSAGAGGPAAPAPMETLWRALWPSFGFQGPAFLVIQDAAAWRALWARAGPDAPPPPDVDFTERTVLVAAYGNALSLGYSVEIVGLHPLPNGTISVSVELTLPAPGCAVGMAITNPTHMVSIPKAAGPFQFSPREVPLPCP